LIHESNGGFILSIILEQGHNNTPGGSLNPREPDKNYKKITRIKYKITEIEMTGA